MPSPASGLRRRLSPYLLTALGTILGPALYLVYQGFDFVPGRQPESESCAADVGAELTRHGHSEELLWRGCLIASETGTYLVRFAPARDIGRSTADAGDIPSCLSCHDGDEAPSFAAMWTRFPRYDEQKQGPEDFAQAIQDEMELRYNGIRPNRSDKAITALYFYAAAKARQSGLRFNVEEASDRPLTDAVLADLAPSSDCRDKFDQKGWPKGSNAPGVIRGCNLVTETRKHLQGPIARQWRIDLTCQSCHLDAGDKPHSGSLGYAAAISPQMHTATNQPIRFDRRVLLCFSNSLNAYDLGLDAGEITYINIYANWLAQKEDLPIGRLSAGYAMPALNESLARGASFLAGEKVYKDHCRTCHGPSGLGGVGPVFRGREPPPITGPHTFNAAASMADPSRFAGFVYANMPYGATMEQPILTPQEAMDVSAYLTSLGRPADVARVNQLRVLLNHLWLKAVAMLGAWMPSLGGDVVGTDQK